MKKNRKSAARGSRPQRAVKPASPPVATSFDPPGLLPIVRAPWWQWWLPAILVALAAVVVYWPTLHNGFVNWDDPDYLEKNDYVSDWQGLPRIWTPHPWEKHEQYYPMVFSTFWLEHKIGLWARGKDLSIDYDELKPEAREFHAGDYHLTNMLLHAINSALVIWLLRALGATPWVAWWVAGLFALHPINVASVAWAAERKNVLSGLFALLSLTLYIRDTRRSSWKAYAGCLVLYVFALLSKTAMVALPVIAVLCDRLITGRWLQRTLIRVSPMLVLALLAAAVTTFNERASAKETMIALDIPLRPFAASGALWFYIWKMFVPVTFPGVYPRWDLTGSNVLFILAMVALLAVAVVVWKLRRRLPGQVIWGLVFYVISLGPMLGLISFNYTQFTFVADHFVYLASIGIFLCVAIGVHWLGRGLGTGWLSLAPITVLACAVLGSLGMTSYRQNQTVWKSGKTFWSYTLKHNPLCWPGHYNLANIYRREWSRSRKEGIQTPERLEKAAEHYRLAAVARPDLHQAHKNRGDTLATLNEYDRAIAAYRQALEIRPSARTYWYQLAVTLEQARRWDEAEEAWRKLIELGPRRPAYQAGLARSLEGQRRWSEAEQAWRVVIRAQPDKAAHHHHLGWVLHKQGKLQEAIHEYERALQLNPGLKAARRALEQAEREQQEGQGWSAGQES